MEPVDPSFGSQPIAPPASPRPKWVPVLVSCTAGCVVLIVIATVAIIVAFKNASGSYQEADTVSRRFFQLVDENKLDDAYSSTSVAWQRQSSLKDFKSFAGFVRQHLGKLRNTTMVNSRWFSGTGGMVITLYYDLAGSAGSGHATMTLVKEGGALKVGGCQYNPGSSSGAGAAGG